MSNFDIAQVSINASIGAAGGFLARHRAPLPALSEGAQHRSLWFASTAVLGGLVIASRGPSPQAQRIAESAILTGGTLFARQLGTYAAELGADSAADKINEQQRTSKPNDASD